MTETDKAARAEQLAALETRTEEEQAELDALTDELTTPAPAPTEAPTEAQGVTPAPKRRRRGKGTEAEGEEPTPGVRFAAYNKSLGRYEGPVRDREAEAEAVAAVARQDGKYVVEVREVK